MSASMIATRLATVSELGEVIALCIAAFADEAVISWVLPDPVTRVRHMETMFGASLGSAVEAQAVILAVTAHGEPIAASIWVPRAEPSAPAEPLTADDPVTRRLAAVQEATEAHHPEVPHLYLSSMAVRPGYRNQGAGGAMITSGLTRASELDLPVYLEASTPANRTLYERHGFRDGDKPIRLFDDGPVLQPMWADRWPVGRHVTPSAAFRQASR